MPLSSLLIGILQQASEPLHCLHGAGYFTPEEWIQLDLIMNKKYTWTNGPSSLISIDTRNAVDLERETTSLFVNGKRDMCSSDNTSWCASDPVMGEVNNSPASLNANWRCSMPVTSAKSHDSRVPDPTRPSFLKHPHERALNGHSITRLETPKSSSGSSGRGPSRYSASGRSSDVGSNNLHIQKSKNIAVRKFEVKKSPQHEPKNNHIVQASTSTSSSQSRKKSARSSKQTVSEKASETQGDVNTFETSNAAEWDNDNHVQDEHTTTQEGTSDLAVDSLEKVATIGEEEQPKTDAQPFVSSPRLATCDRSRVLDVPRLTCHKESKDRKASKDGEPASQQKTRVCWFWAESPGGCRYQSEECLNLHMKPTPNALLKNSLKESLSMKGSLISKGSQMPSPPTKPKTCWYWATSGTCEKGDECKKVHGWVQAGVEDCPEEVDSQKMLSKTTDEKKLVVLDTTEQENEGMLLDLELGDLEINDVETTLVTPPSPNIETELDDGQSCVSKLLS